MQGFRGRLIAGMTVPAVLVVAACGAAAPGGDAASGGDAAAEAGRSPEAVLGDSLIDAWIAEAGGMDRYHDIESARFTVTTVWYDSLGEIRRMRPRRVEMRRTDGAELARIERPEAEGLYVQTYDGNGVWATLNDRLLADTTPQVEETEYVARDVVYWFGLPFKLRDPGVNRSARRLPDGGYEVAVTFGDTVGIHPGDRYFYYFQDEDPYPEEVHYIEQDREEVDRNRTRWGEMGRVDGYAYITSRIWFDTLGNPTKELRMDDVWLNPPLPDELFARPH